MVQLGLLHSYRPHFTDVETKTPPPKTLVKKRLYVYGPFSLATTLTANILKLLFFFGLLRATPEAFGVYQARGPIGAVAAGLHHSHSNARS